MSKRKIIRPFKSFTLKLIFAISLWSTFTNAAEFEFKVKDYYSATELELYQIEKAWKTLDIAKLIINIK